MEEYIKTNLGKKDTFRGNGIDTIILHSDPNALQEWLDLSMGSNAAGNTELRNKLVSICDEWLRQTVIHKSYYKQIMLQL